jgi:hypothetical protein
MIAQGLDHYFAYYEAPLATFAQLRGSHSAAHLERLKRNVANIGIVAPRSRYGDESAHLAGGAAFGRCRCHGG